MFNIEFLCLGLRPKNVDSLSRMLYLLCRLFLRLEVLSNHEVLMILFPYPPSSAILWGSTAWPGAISSYILFPYWVRLFLSSCSFRSLLFSLMQYHTIKMSAIQTRTPTIMITNMLLGFYSAAWSFLIMDYINICLPWRSKRRYSKNVWLFYLQASLYFSMILII